MEELIACATLAISLGGIGAIFYRKIPALLALTEATEPAKEMPVGNLKEKIKNIPFLKSLSFEIFLQKILSRIKVLTLKTENKVSLWLEALRKRSQQKKVYANENYWQEIKEKAVSFGKRRGRPAKEKKEENPASK